MLTSKQRAYLRGLANTLEPVLQVGKDGVGENLIAQADGVLEKRELIKGNVLENSPLSAREAAQAIAGVRVVPRAAGQDQAQDRTAPVEEEISRKRKATSCESVSMAAHLIRRILAMFMRRRKRGACWGWINS